MSSKPGSLREFPYSTAHLCGIGGAGMSGLAHILMQQGVQVSGSDRSPSAVTERLIEAGAQISYREAEANVPPGAEVLIHSAAIREDHPERRAAIKLGIPQQKYAQALGTLTRMRRTLAVCGTHGKTSTTTMLATLLQRGLHHPSWVIGGKPVSLPSPAHWDDGEELVVEACEYDHSFLRLHPDVILINNIEPDHLDCFPTIEALKSAFFAFVGRLPRNGLLVVNAGSSAAMEVAALAKCRVLTFGVEVDADFSARDIRFRGGATEFCLQLGNRALTDLKLSLPGRVYLENALGAIAVAMDLGLGTTTLLGALAQPIGVARRFERIDDIAGVPVIDDYAHHPTAVRELLETARNVFSGARLRCVFQAHQYARLLNFFDEFVDGLALANEVIVCPTYAAREAGITVGEPEGRLVKELQRRGVNATYVHNFDEAEAQLRDGWAPGQAVMTIGAGDVTEVAHRLRSVRTAIVAQVGADSSGSRYSSRNNPPESESCDE